MVQEYRRTINLLDGRQAIIRSICSEDKIALLSFHSRLSDESLFLRYHYTKGQLTEADLRNFCDIDYYNNLALVTEIEVNGKKEIIGVGRYCRIPDTDMAEVAFVVQDNEQRKGIGTLLLQCLAVWAWNQGIRHFYGEVLRQNGRMLSIFRKFDPTMKQEIDDHTTCTVMLSVADAMCRKLSDTSTSVEAKEKPEEAEIV